MGVFADEENLSHTIRRQITSPGMHWQQHQHERYVGPAYDPSRDLSPNLPACDATASSMSSGSGPNTNNSDNEPPVSGVKVSGSLCSTPSGTSNSSSTSSSSSSSSSTSSGSACSTPSHNNNNNNIQCHQNNPSINNNNNNSTCALSSSEMCRISSHDYHNQHFPPIQIPKLEPVTTPPPPSSNRPYGQNSVNDVLSASGDVDDDNIRTRTSAGTFTGHCKNNNNSPLAAICAGCGQLISDRFYLQAVDRRWHAACLQCCQCRHTLDGEVTCFSRNGNIYCKKDYFRLFGMKRCARCQASILSTELVMRARDLVFHVHCFTCEICNAPLTKGDHFGMRDAAVLCRLHYEMSSHHESTSPSGILPQIRGGGLIPPPTSGGPLGGCQPHGGGVLIPGHSPPSGLHPNTVPPPPGSGSLHHYPPSFPSPSDFHHNMSPGGGGSGHHPHISPSPQLTSQPPPPGSMGDTNKVPSFYNGAPTSTPRQKGRPRKRKPKDIESMTANLDINSDYLDMPYGRSPGTPGMHGSSSRTKRMRTSFKHHQLRTMKSYFAINHNPDAKDLKQLSQKTGLPKRVLQVWFQNARAKWRRMMQKQEGKSGDKCSGSESGGMNDLDLYPHDGPGSLTGSIQSLPPHSPQFLLGPGSPNSLDCN